MSKVGSSGSKNTLIAQTESENAISVDLLRCHALDLLQCFTPQHG
jgi:hypothetical protein